MLLIKVLTLSGWEGFWNSVCVHDVIYTCTKKGITSRWGWIITHNVKAVIATHLIPDMVILSSLHYIRCKFCTSLTSSVGIVMVSVTCSWNYASLWSPTISGKKMATLSNSSSIEGWGAYKGGKLNIIPFLWKSSLKLKHRYRALSMWITRVSSAVCLHDEICSAKHCPFDISSCNFSNVSKK